MNVASGAEKRQGDDRSSPPLRLILSRRARSGPDEARDRDENHGAQRGDQNRPEEAARPRDAEKAEDPLADDAAGEAEGQVNEDSVPRATHDLAREESSNDANDDRDEHGRLLRQRCGWPYHVT